MCVCVCVCVCVYTHIKLNHFVVHMSHYKSTILQLKNKNWGLTWWLSGNLPTDAGDASSVSGLGRSPGEGNGNLFQYACLENPFDRRAWWVTYSPWSCKVWIWLSNKIHTHTHINQWIDSNYFFKLQKKKYPFNANFVFTDSFPEQKINMYFIEIFVLLLFPQNKNF